MSSHFRIPDDSVPTRLPEQPRQEAFALPTEPSGLRSHPTYRRRKASLFDADHEGLLKANWYSVSVECYLDRGSAGRATQSTRFPQVALIRSMPPT